MTNTEKKEAEDYELVLGNKQLLSFFFIGVVLLSVSFTLGYVIGRNSAPAAEFGGQKAEYRTSDAPSALAANDRSRSAPREDVGPVRDSQPVPPAAEQTAAPATRTVEPGIVTQPAPGTTYLQVIAVARPEAEVLVEVLGKKGFPAVLAPGPDDRMFRVLVGPTNDTADIVKYKNELEQAGFKGAFIKKY